MPLIEVRRLRNHEAVAQALELLIEHWRRGHVASFSIHAEAGGVSRVSIAYQADADPIDWSSPVSTNS